MLLSMSMCRAWGEWCHHEAVLAAVHHAVAGGHGSEGVHPIRCPLCCPPARLWLPAPRTRMKPVLCKTLSE